MIRLAISQDATVLLSLLENQFQEHGIGLETGKLEAALSQLLRDPGLGFILLAEAGGRPVGLAAVSLAWTLEHGGRTAWLDELYLLPDHRNAGIGSALIERALDEARRAGCLAVDLEVDREHARAEGLYKRYGFEQLPRSRWVKILD